MDRRATGRTAAAALLLTLSLAGCGGDERDKQRERVDRYIKDEQAVMERAQPGFERANEAYVAYARGELDGAEAVARAREAQRTIRNARDGVSVLDPPREAQPLHDKLMSYLDINIELARETTRLAAYVPRAARVLAPLEGANRRLESGLADASDSATQALAMERFSEALEAIARDLRALQPPLVLEHAHDGQLRRLESTRALVGKLRRALRDEDAEKLARLLKRFRATASDSGARRLLARQALARYGRRLEQLNDAYADVQRVQLRLDRALR
jgi:hypothetical protein